MTGHRYLDHTVCLTGMEGLLMGIYYLASVKIDMWISTCTAQQYDEEEASSVDMGMSRSENNAAAMLL